MNGGFDGSLAPWVPLTADSGTFVASNSNAVVSVKSSIPQRLVQALSVCPGTRYIISFSGRRDRSTAGTTGRATALLIIDGTTYATFSLSSSDYFTTITPNLRYTATTSLATLVVEVSIQSTAYDQALTAVLDNIKLTPVP
jgi:hypothetical protein